MRSHYTGYSKWFDEEKIFFLEKSIDALALYFFVVI
jgi:hypothetical protein